MTPREGVPYGYAVERTTDGLRFGTLYPTRVDADIAATPSGYYRVVPLFAIPASTAAAREGALALLKEARDGLQLDADERKQQLASLSVARPGMFDALVYNDAEIKRNRALVARIDEALAHPAATAREEAWKAMVEACERIYDSASRLSRSARPCRDGHRVDSGVLGEVESDIDDLRAALALARSTGGVK